MHCHKIHIVSGTTLKKPLSRSPVPAVSQIIKNDAGFIITHPQPGSLQIHYERSGLVKNRQLRAIRSAKRFAVLTLRIGATATRFFSLFLLKYRQKPVAVRLSTGKSETCLVRYG
jgi:hypothetical protein